MCFATGAAPSVGSRSRIPYTLGVPLLPQAAFMTTLVVVIFCLVYLGMILGGLPLLSLDRTGIALLGAIALLALRDLTLMDAAQAVHLPTIILLFAFMVVSAQLRLSGFYAR